MIVFAVCFKDCKFVFVCLFVPVVVTLVVPTVVVVAVIIVI
jgi:hypothetical protein